MEDLRSHDNQPSKSPHNPLLSPQSMEARTSTRPDPEMSLAERAIQLADLLDDHEKAFKHKLRDLERLHRESTRDIKQQFVDFLDLVVNTEEDVSASASPQLSRKDMQPLDHSTEDIHRVLPIASPYETFVPQESTTAPFTPLQAARESDTQIVDSGSHGDSLDNRSGEIVTPQAILNPLVDGTMPHDDDPILEDGPGSGKEPTPDQQQLPKPAVAPGHELTPGQGIQSGHEPVPGQDLLVGHEPIPGPEPMPEQAPPREMPPTAEHEPVAKNETTKGDAMNLSGTSKTPPAPTPTRGKQLGVPKSSPSSQPSPAKDKIRWSDEEEEYMINILHELVQGRDPKDSKGKMWQLASERMKARGYDRTNEKMAAKWSLHTRKKCEDRGFSWAESVMSKHNFAPRNLEQKRRLDSMEGDETESEPTPGAKDNTERLRKRPRKVLAHSGRLSYQSSSASSPTTDQPLRMSGDQLHLRCTWGCAAHDLVDVDWSPDGTHFIAASTAIVNEEEDNFESNQPRNLLFGSLPTQSIRELPDHRGGMGMPDHVYQTVSAVRYAQNGRRFFSAGFDGKLRIWDVANESSIKCTTQLDHQKRLIVMDLADRPDTLLATGIDHGTKSICIFYAESDLSHSPFPRKPFRPLSKSFEKGNFRHAPTCLKFGKSNYRDWLVAGFGSDQFDGDLAGGGCTMVWRLRDGDVEVMPFSRGQTTVFDCAWAEDGRTFAIGCASASPSTADATEHSVVKLYSIADRNPVTTLSCRAKDMNQVTIHDIYVTASCTDGSTYVWDQRHPQRPLHTLTHGMPAIQIDEFKDRELTDVGVRFIEWSDDPGQLYTGGSDGVLKQWDVRHSPTDALVRDVDEVGVEIMCGKFSPDYSSLLIGDDGGGVYLYSKSKKPQRVDQFKFIPAVG